MKTDTISPNTKIPMGLLMDDTFKLFEDNGQDYIYETTIDKDSIIEDAKKEAGDIINCLSNYYFDESTLKEQPYLLLKLNSSVNNLVTLFKLSKVDDKALEFLIETLSQKPSENKTYQSLFVLQETTLKVQLRMVEIFKDIEQTFKKLAEEYKQKLAHNGGNTTVSPSFRGQRELLKNLQAIIPSLKNDMNVQMNINFEKNNINSETDTQITDTSSPINIPT